MEKWCLYTWILLFGAPNVIHRQSSILQFRLDIHYSKMDRRLLLTILVYCSTLTDAFYVPGVAPVEFAHGAPIDVRVSINVVLCRVIFSGN